MKSQVWFERHLADIEGVANFHAETGWYKHCATFEYEGITFNIDSQYADKTTISPVYELQDKYGRDLKQAFPSPKFTFQLSKYKPIMSQLHSFAEEAECAIKSANEWVYIVNQRIESLEALHSKYFALLYSDKEIYPYKPNLSILTNSDHIFRDYSKVDIGNRANIRRGKLFVDFQFSIPLDDEETMQALGDFMKILNMNEEKNHVKP